MVPTTVSIENSTAIGSEDFLSRFSRNIILLDGETAGLQKALTNLGEHTHFEPDLTISSPPRLHLSPFRYVSDSILTYNRPKISMDKTFGFQAVLRGNQGPMISLVRQLEK